MRKSLIEGFKEKDMQAMVDKMTLNAFYYPTLCPEQFSPTLTISGLSAATGVPIMADVISFNATTPKKAREIVSKFTGSIPKISIKRALEEDELNYLNMLNHSLKATNNPEAAKAILDFVYNDLDFCFTGVGARLEWLFLQGLSKGKVTLDKTNNAGVKTETAVNYNVPAAQKIGVAIPWTAANKTTSTPITNIRTIVKAAEAKGYKIGYIFMDQTAFDGMAISDETVAFCASWVLQATQLSTTPNLTSVNAALAGSQLPQIILIKQSVQVEIESVRTTLNPWTDGIATFVPDKIVGNTYYAPLAEDMVPESTAVRVKRGYVLLKKYATNEPLTEVTIGMANAFPFWSSALKSYIVDTQETTWTF